MGQSRFYEQVTDTPTVLADAHQHLTNAGWRTGALSQAAPTARPT
ncbi:hypothetical protein C5N14_14900 [Micromonospora sp. MW-13]|nr:hypothetical protein C5N14_14900 [Micromonospora sp. MW-13]